MHYALIGMTRLYYFNPFAVCVHGVRATQADHALMSATLSELDTVLGGAPASQRRWIAGETRVAAMILLFVFERLDAMKVS